MYKPVAYVTSVQVSQKNDFMDMLTWNFPYGAQAITVDLSMVLNGPVNLSFLSNFGQDHLQLQREWRCLYCTRSNLFNYSDCRSCGALRNFLL